MGRKAKNSRKFLGQTLLAAWTILGAVALRAWALPAPGGLSVVAPVDGQVHLIWTPVPSAVGYMISRSLLGTTPTPTPTASGTVTPTVFTSAYEDDQVTNGRSYLYQVSSWDGAATGSAATVEADPFSIPAAVPVQVSNLHSQALDLFWSVPNSTYQVSAYQIYVWAVSSTPTLAVTATPTKPPPSGSTATFSPTPYLNDSVLATITPLATVADGGLSYTDSSVAGSTGKVFYYVVRAVDNLSHLGNIPTGNGVGGVPKDLPPQSPNLIGLIGSATPVINASGPVPGYGVRLIWNEALDVEHVAYYQVSINNTPVATQWATPLATATYDDPNVPFSGSVGNSTSYKVTAFVSDPTPGVDSNTLFETVYKASVSGNLQVTPDATAHAVTLTWNQGIPGSYGLNGYRLYKGIYSQPATVGVGTPSPTPTITPTPFAVVAVSPSVTVVLTPYVETGVTTAHGYSYWVEPYDGLGLGGVPAVPTPAFLDLAPGPVDSVSAANPVGNNQVQVSWGQSAPGFYGPPVNYVIYRELPMTLTPTPVATVSATETSFTDYPPGAPGTAVLYQVAGVDGLGNTGALLNYSNVVTLGSIGVPSQPEGVLASGTTSSIQFAWLNNPLIETVSEYDLYGSDWPTLTVTPTPLATFLPTPSTLSYTDNSVSTWDASFHYLVARNPNGASQPATLSAIPVPSYQVTALVTPGIGGAQVWISSSMAPQSGSTPAINSYSIYRSLTPGAGFTPVATVLIPTPGYLDSLSAPGLTYYYRVAARASGGGRTAESPLYPTQTPIPEAAAFSEPNNPTGLTVLGMANPTVLYWAGNNPGEEVLSYTLYRNGTAVQVVTPSPTLNAAFTETPGAVYYYQVSAQNASGSSDLSSPLSVLAVPSITPTVGLTPPPSFKPTPGTTPAIPRLVWVSGLDYPGAVSGYDIYRSTDSGFSWSALVGSTTKPVSNISDAGVTGYVNYYKAVARTEDGLESNQAGVGSVPVSIWPNPAATPMIVANASAVSLMWSEPDGNVEVTGYVVYRATGPGGPLSLIGQVSVPTPAPTAVYVDGAVTEGRAYYYWVDSVGNSLTSDRTISPFGSVIPLDPPVLQVTPGPGRNTLVWSPASVSTPTDVTGYVVYRMSMPTPVAPLLTPVFSQVGSVVEGLNNTTYADTAVSDNVGYAYRVAAASLGGAVLSSFSAPQTGVVELLPVMNLAAVSGNGIVQLRWEYQGTPNNIYNLQRKLGTDSDSNYQTIKAGVTGINYDDTNVGNKTFYNYRIVTTNPQTSEAPVTSNTAEALPAEPPILPENASVTIAQEKPGNILRWGAADPPGAVYLSGIDPTQMYPLGGYHIYRSLDGGGTYVQNGVNQWVGEVGPDVTTFEDVSGVTVVGNNYTYLVTAFDSPPDNPSMAHESPYNLVTVASVAEGTALDRNAMRPGNMVVHIRVVVPSTGNVEIKVFTLSGVFVKKICSRTLDQGFHDHSTDGDLEWDGTNMYHSQVASGVYLITTEMNGMQEIHKVAVIR